MANKWVIGMIERTAKLPDGYSITDFVSDEASIRASELEGPNSPNFDWLCESLAEEVFDALYDQSPTV